MNGCSSCDRPMILDPHRPADWLCECGETTIYLRSEYEAHRIVHYYQSPTLGTVEWSLEFAPMHEKP